MNDDGAEDETWENCEEAGNTWTPNATVKVWTPYYTGWHSVSFNTLQEQCHIPPQYRGLAFRVLTPCWMDSTLVQHHTLTRVPHQLKSLTACKDGGQPYPKCTLTQAGAGSGTGSRCTGWRCTGWSWGWWCRCSAHPVGRERFQTSTNGQVLILPLVHVSAQYKCQHSTTKSKWSTEKSKTECNF